MWIRAASLIVLASSGVAVANEPMSAIDWLSKSVNEKPAPGTTTELPARPALPGEINVTRLDEIRKDSVGLLPSGVSGLPAEFWAGSSTRTIADLIARQKTDALPEILSLLYTILLAELDAPQDDTGQATLLLARTDKLLDLGALQQAQALLERAGPTEAEIFRRWFDVSLLTGHADHACTAMRASPGFAPTLQARVFCLARGGDWNAAALTLATGETLGFVSHAEADLMSRFLDPGMFEGDLDLPPPTPMTPLDFTMREAIALPRPPGPLPLAFANADLDRSAAWRSQLTAAERLVRTQALAPNHLIDLYTARHPAASGGVWDRVAAIGAFDVALLAGDRAAIAASLPKAYAMMQEIALEVPFSRHYGDRLAGFEFSDPEAAATAFKVALLSDGYETAVARFEPANARDRFLKALASGQLLGVPPPDLLSKVIAQAFLEPLPDGALANLLAEGKLGEAILRAMLLLANEAFADPGDIRTALAVFRAVGLESEARKTAIQLLLLERRG